MSGANWLTLGAVLAGVAVAAGAFGAHGLEESRWEPDLPTFETAVRYQMYHALGLLALGWVVRSTEPSRAATIAGWAFLVGIVLFSGGLYLWIFTDVRFFVLIVPLGGTSFIVGWIALAIATRGFAR